MGDVCRIEVAAKWIAKIPLSAMVSTDRRNALSSTDQVEKPHSLLVCFPSFLARMFYLFLISFRFRAVIAPTEEFNYVTTGISHTEFINHAVCALLDAMYHVDPFYVF